MAKTLTVTKTCTFCNKVHNIEVDADKFARWKDGEHVQKVWPEMTSDEREVLISGTCPKCWEEAFGA